MVEQWPMSERHFMDTLAGLAIGHGSHSFDCPMVVSCGLALGGPFCESALGGHCESPMIGFLGNGLMSYYLLCNRSVLLLYRYT